METLDTDCEVIFFVSSAGRCNLDCHYCIVAPEGRREGSLTYEDLRFLYEHFGQKAFFMFSGKGDFFSGYKRSEKLLSRLLDHDVEVGLDINATLLQELPELPGEKLRKLRHVNVAMHYHELVRLDLREPWVENTRWILENLGHAKLIVGTVMDPSFLAEWDDALDFYERHVFSATGQPIHMIRHLNKEYTEAEEAALADVARRHASVVATVLRQDYVGMFRDAGELSCPAGHRFFRVWNDGRVQGCTHIPELSLLGGLKERILIERDAPYPCSSAGHCDCYFVTALGKMGCATSRATVDSAPVA